MQLGAEAVEALRVPLRATNDLAQAVGAGQLDLRQGDEPRPDRQPAEPEVGAVLFDQAFELGPQQKLQKLVEHALLGPHGIAFCCPKTSRDTLEAEESAPSALFRKTKRDSRGPTPSHAAGRYLTGLSVQRLDRQTLNPIFWLTVSRKGAPDTFFGQELYCEVSDRLKRAVSGDSGQEEGSASQRSSAAERLLLRTMVAGARPFVRSGSIELHFRDEDPLFLGDGRGEVVKVYLKRLPALIRIMANPGLAIGETYVDGDWEVADADLARLLGCLLVNEGRIEALTPVRMLNDIRDLAARAFHANTARQSRRNAAHHYDIGNDLYEAFLDQEMVYSCAFFTPEAHSLEAAQRHKLATTLDRVGVGPGMRVLDIGCGWGALTRAIAMRDAQAVGITLSEQQLTLAEQRLPRALQGKASYRLEDYRRHAEENPVAYDRVVSIGMFEHVGRRHFVDYYRAVNRLLKPGGRALVHSIIKPTRSRTNAWLKKYIFPGGQIPQLAEMTDSAKAAGLLLPHEPIVHEGSHYATTLRHWRRRFNDNFASLDHSRYDQRFRRLWNFYLAGSAAAFDALGYQVAQVIFEKPA